LCRILVRKVKTIKPSQKVAIALEVNLPQLKCMEAVVLV